MKNLILIISLLLLSKLIYSQNWSSTTTNTTLNLYAIDFTPDSTGWAVSFNPTNIYKSTDYGQTWNLNYSPPITTLSSVKFINDSVGFVGGAHSGDVAIYKTIDSGSTWTATTILAHTLWLPSAGNIEFSPQGAGYVFGHRGSLFVHDPARNGNSRWRLVSSRPTSSNIWGGHVFGSNNLLVASDNLYRKNGSTSSWDTVHVGTTYDIDFINDSVGYAITDSSIIKTDDKGASWDSLSKNPLSANVVPSIEAIDTNEIYIAGYDNKIYRSTDGGINWTLDNTKLNASFIKKIKKFKSDVWASGSGGQILKRNVSLVGLNGEDQKEIGPSIYPNPANTLLNIDFSSINEKTPTIVNLIRSDGALILTKKVNSNHFVLNVESYPPGIYIIECSFDKGELVRKKVIIQ